MRFIKDLFLNIYTKINNYSYPKIILFIIVLILTSIDYSLFLNMQEITTYIQNIFNTIEQLDNAIKIETINLNRLENYKLIKDIENNNSEKIIIISTITSIIIFITISYYYFF